MQNNNIISVVKALDDTTTMMNPKKQLEAMGFILNGDKVIDLKSLVFAKHILSTMLILYATGDRFFSYNNGKWEHFKDNDFHRLIFGIIDKLAPNQWKPAWEGGYMIALTRITPKAEDLDGDKQHINLLNGMFNILDFQLLPHDPKYRSSVQIPLANDGDADCPRFLKFLNEVFEGDTSIIEVVQEMMGYCLTAETRAHKVFVLEGAGSNGKSVLLEILERLVGVENVSHIPMNDFAQPFARAEIVGKTLNVSTENEFDERGFNTQYIKSITSGDKIRVDVKHEKGFSYKPICKLVFAMNHLPTVKDKSHGFFRRLVIIPFRRVFNELEADKKLTDKLLLELPGIFNFAIQGLKRLVDNEFNFSHAEKINNAILGYKSDQNPVIPFFYEHIRQGDDNSDRLDCNGIFEAFRLWSKRNGEPAFLQGADRDRKKFWSAFRSASLEAGITPKEQKTSNGKRYLPGLKLIPLVIETEADDSVLSAIFSESTTTRSRIPTPRKLATVPATKLPVSIMEFQDSNPLMSEQDSDTHDDWSQPDLSDECTIEEDEDSGATNMDEFPCEELDEIDLQIEHSYLVQLEQGRDISIEDWQEEWLEYPFFCQVNIITFENTEYFQPLDCQCSRKTIEYSYLNQEA